MTSHLSPPFVKELRNQLVDAARRQTFRRRRRLRLMRGGITALACLTIALGIVHLSEQPSSAGVLTVRHENDGTYVDLTSENATPEEIVRELKEEGIRATVSHVPVPPQGVGKFLALSNSTAQPLDPGTMFYRTFRVVDTSQLIDLMVGRPSGPHEKYARAVNAYAKGGPLHCSDLYGKFVADALPYLESLDVQVHWRRVVNGTVQNLEVDPATMPRDFVSTAMSESADSLIIYASTATTPLFAEDVSASGSKCN